MCRQLSALAASLIFLSMTGCCCCHHRSYRERQPTCYAEPSCSCSCYEGGMVEAGRPIPMPSPVPASSTVLK